MKWGRGKKKRRERETQKYLGQEEFEGDGHIMSTARKQRTMNADAQLF